MRTDTNSIGLGAALVVDRDASAATRMTKALIDAGYRPVYQVGDASAAREYIEGSLELVVCDLACEDAQAGVELVRVLSEHRDAPHVVVSCACSEGKLIASALQAGAHAYVEYPVSAEQVLETVARKTSPDAVTRRLARLMVGRVGVLQALSMLRGEMVKWGLQRENNSRRATAKLLGVDRKVIQRVLADEACAAGAVGDGWRKRTHSGTHRLERGGPGSKRSPSTM